MFVEEWICNNRTSLASSSIQGGPIQSTGGSIWTGHLKNSWTNRPICTLDRTSLNRTWDRRGPVIANLPRVARVGAGLCRGGNYPQLTLFEPGDKFWPPYYYCPPPPNFWTMQRLCNKFILTFSGRDCMDNVCRRVNLQQPDLFGLKFYSRRSYPKYRWVDLDRPLKKQLDKYAQQPTGPLHLGTIHILRKHLYSKKSNFS